MRIWILWAWIPLTAFAQNNWEELMQPSNVLQHKIHFSSPFIHHNSFGSISMIDSGSIGISVENKYSLKELSKINLSGQFKMHNGGLGLHFNGMGNDVFNGISFSVNYGLRLSRTFGLGIGIRSRRDQIRLLMPLFIIMPQVGLVYFFSKKASIGINLRKRFRPGMQLLPSYKEFGMISTSFGYQFDDQFYCAIELINDMRQPSYFNIYSEWQPASRFNGYILYQTRSTQMQVGFNYSLKKIQMGMGVAQHTYLGNSFYLTIHNVR